MGRGPGQRFQFDSTSRHRQREGGGGRLGLTFTDRLFQFLVSLEVDDLELFEVEG